MLVVSFLGFLDATYLTVKHYLGEGLTCGFFQGCEEVTTSVYSEILGVPVSLLGSIYYISVFLAVAYYLDSQKRSSLALASYATISGFVMTLYFLYIQAFVLQAFCVYCLGSALTSTLLFLAGVSVLWRSKRMQDG